MPKGGYKPNAGRPRKPDSELSRPRQKKPAAKKVSGVLVDAIKVGNEKLTDDDKKIEEKIIEGDELVSENLSPLEFALKIMNDPKQEAARRDRMAIAALPFMHMKKGEGGKKEAEKDNAHAAAKGKFNPSAPPKLAVVGK
jgi:phage terminase small subunit